MDVKHQVFVYVAAVPLGASYARLAGACPCSVAM
jgi:hypothetical protein